MAHHCLYMNKLVSLLSLMRLIGQQLPLRFYAVLIIRQVRRMHCNWCEMCTSGGWGIEGVIETERDSACWCVSVQVRIKLYERWKEDVTEIGNKSRCF